MAWHNQVGKWGEDIACRMLVSEGATIRERNWRCGNYEIDIIASQGNEFIFAEVKTRSNPDEDPLEAVDKAKIRHIVRAADSYLRGSRIPACPRFDLFAIRGTPENYTVEHIPDAFHPPLKTYR